MNEDRAQENTLDAAKDILFRSVPIRKRLELLLETIGDVKMKELEIDTCSGLISLAETRYSETDDLEHKRENLKDELRELKNSFRRQEAALHEIMRTTDEV
jgi:hypothetical protein